MIDHLIMIDPPKKIWINTNLVAANFVVRNKFWAWLLKLLRINEGIEIQIYLGEHHYRKNVSHLRVAMDVNDYFLAELICAMTRVMRKKTRRPLCEVKGNKYKIDCPLSNVWNKMRLII